MSFLYFIVSNLEYSRQSLSWSITSYDKNESSLVTISSDDTIRSKGLTKNKIKLVSYPTKNEILKQAEIELRCSETKSVLAHVFLVFVAIRYYSNIKFWCMRSMKMI